MEGVGWGEVRAVSIVELNVSIFCGLLVCGETFLYEIPSCDYFVRLW